MDSVMLMVETGSGRAPFSVCSPLTFSEVEGGGRECSGAGREARAGSISDSNSSTFPFSFPFPFISGAFGPFSPDVPVAALDAYVAGGSGLDVPTVFSGDLLAVFRAAARVGRFDMTKTVDD